MKYDILFLNKNKNNYIPQAVLDIIMKISNDIYFKFNKDFTDEKIEKYNEYRDGKNVLTIILLEDYVNSSNVSTAFIDKFHKIICNIIFESKYRCKLNVYMDSYYLNEYKFIDRLKAIIQEYSLNNNADILYYNGES